MEPFLDILSSAQPVDVPPHLITSIKQRIAKERTGQRRWLRTAVAAAILMWGVQGYVLAKAGWEAISSEQVVDLVPHTNNSLYGYE